MVKKLFKHEFSAYLLTLFPLYAVLLGVALVGRVVQFFESDSTSYGLISGASFFIYGVAVLAAWMLTAFFGIVRFYKNMFTGEGYLTLTLPVTPAQHLWVKTLTAVAFEVISFVVILLSAVILVQTDVLIEVLKAARYLLIQIPAPLNQHLVWYVLEFSVAMVISMCAGMLSFYACISIGQLFRKNRVVASIGIYFAYYTIVQILSTIISVVAMIVGPLLPLDQWMQTIAAHPYASVHIFLCALTPLSLISVAIFFAVSHYIIRKKLNLE